MCEIDQEISIHVHRRRSCINSDLNSLWLLIHNVCRALWLYQSSKREIPYVQMEYAKWFLRYFLQRQESKHQH